MGDMTYLHGSFRLLTRSKQKENSYLLGVANGNFDGVFSRPSTRFHDFGRRDPIGRCSPFVLIAKKSDKKYKGQG